MTTPAQADTCRVKPGASAAADGASWATATSLQHALDEPLCTELWVAAGVYTPSVHYVVDGNGDDPADPRTATFYVLPGKAVYGGFAGSESERAQRDPASNLSVLSGDIDGNDAYDLFFPGIDPGFDAIQGNNAFHVVTMDGTTGTPLTLATVLDGFVITGGSAGYPGGGGLLCSARSVADALCQPTLGHLLFIGNLTTYNGGALLNDAIYGGSASPYIHDSSFVGNGAHTPHGASKGGAIYNEGYGGQASPLIINVTFTGNSAALGGALYNDGYGGLSSPLLQNVTFSGNRAGEPESDVAVSGSGGAVYNNAQGGISEPGFVNVILWGDAVGAGGSGAEVYNTTGDGNTAVPSFGHSIVAGSGGSGGAWDASLGTDNGGNLDIDPLLGALQYRSGFVPTMSLPFGSPAIDAGDDGVCATTDARGVARPQGLHCDIGAFESDVIFAGGFDGPATGP
ncbi:MAG TPA: choice-of-anchor Q domain-containing protein [Rhodanobacteraceae bacterium]|nr:choice-of-anchor Q domain-containing protein [Rhodanobacteraceae bacterium]